MQNQTLQYYMHDGPSAFRIELAGILNHEGATRLNADWQTTSRSLGVKCRVIDITFVTEIDDDGRELLLRWRKEGAQFVASTDDSRALGEAVLGEPIPPGNPRVMTAGRTWLPVRATFVAGFLVLASMNAKAGTLKPETNNAWEQYVRSADARLQERLTPGGCFLWTFDDETRAAKVRSGEIVVAPAPGPSPRKVPGGLVHHWIGAVFLPGVTIDNVLAVTRDYDRFKHYYRPSVVESKTVARKGPEDTFSMRLMNKALFLKFALDADYQAVNVRVTENRAYSITKTTRVQEIEKYGQDDEHRSPEGEGIGYIWKLHGISRLEQRDGGVYVELEALALSREVPAAFHLFVDPIVRRVSRNSLLISLQQTVDAVREQTTKPYTTSDSGNPGASGTSGSPTGKRSGFAATQ